MEELESYPYAGHGGLLSGKAPTWQRTDELLARFFQTAAAARRAYQGFLAEGVGMGKRADLIGGGLVRSAGGLVRSAGGWEQVSLARHFGERLKSDERILGNSDFVDGVLGWAQEEMK